MSGRVRQPILVLTDAERQPSDPVRRSLSPLAEWVRMLAIAFEAVDDGHPCSSVMVPWSERARDAIIELGGTVHAHNNGRLRYTVKIGERVSVWTLSDEPGEVQP